LDKNTKPEEMRAIVQKRQRRALMEKSKDALVFRVRGQVVEARKIERWMRRHDVVESEPILPVLLRVWEMWFSNVLVRVLTAKRYPGSSELLNKL
jgi:hypothetical protein